MDSDHFSPVFVGGHRKSGTTMLLGLFDSHPEFCVYPVDLTLLYAYYPLFESAAYSDADKRSRLEAVVFNHLEQNTEITKSLNIESFRQAFFSRMGEGPWDTCRAIEQLVYSYQEAMEPSEGITSRCLVKETSCEIFATSLFSWFPNAKFVHLIRDPRDNYAALQSGVAKLYHQYGDDEKTILHSLLERCSLGMKLAGVHRERYGAQRYRVIRFEDLVSAPEATMRDLCSFIGISFEESLLVPTFLGKPTRGNNFDGMDFTQVSKQNVGRWGERIAEEEAQVIEFHFRDLMLEFGYKTAFSEYEQADAAVEFYKWSNYKYHYFDRFKAL